MKNICYGAHPVAALLARRPACIRKLLLAKGRKDKLEHIQSLACAANISVSWVADVELNEQCDQRHQGVVAVVHPIESVTQDGLLSLLDDLGVPPLLLVLDQIQDPHNLGACMRSALAFGVHAVIVPKDNAATLTSVVMKVASGAAAVVPFVRVANLARCLRALAERGVWLVGLEACGSQPVSDLDLRVPTALVMGSEGRGLRQLTRKTCDFLAHIPMSADMESLNISVAAGVSLYEVFRQRLVI